MSAPRILAVWLGVLILAMTAPVFAGDPCAEPVATAAGPVRGLDDGATGTCQWRGIPYAEPPVGELRWKAPQPAAAWTEVRDATQWGDRCVQSSGMLGGDGGGVPMSEDCLNLNVWRPRASGTFPVMVWIHGGGYYTGAGNDPQYWGDRLAAAGDLIVVTINYRLSLLGFLAHPDLRAQDEHNSTGGYGSLDQILALQWVHDNIANFGGDPDNITIFGQSAGGASICSMVATPLAQGLFNRAIMQSGLCELSQDLEAAYQVSRDAMTTLGCDDIECMRRLDAQTIVDQAGAEMFDGFLYMPCHDGYILTDTPLAMIESGNYNRVDFLTGTVLDEFGKAVKLKPIYYYTIPSQYTKRLMKSFAMSAEQAARLQELYPLSDFKGRPVEAMGRMFGADATMQCPTYRGLQALAQDGARSWFYRFEYHGMKLGKYLGSFHTAELPFLFDSFDRSPGPMFYKGRDLVEEQELTRVMQAYWTNFAKTGDPNGPGLPVWKPFTAGDPGLQVLDVGRVENVPDDVAERCQFWKEYNRDFVPMANRLIQSLF